MNGITKSVKTTRAMNAKAAGATNVNADVIQDMQGFESVEYTALLGTITATGVPGIKVQQGDASDGSDMADITGASITGDDTLSNKALVIEVIKPTKRYVRCVVTRATANVVVDGVVAKQSGARKHPVTHDTTVASTKQLVGP